MSIQLLMQVIPPPKYPVDTGGDEDKERIEALIGIQLPSDFWEFGKHYGSGKIVTPNFDVLIYNPFSAVFQDCVEADCDTLRTLKESQWTKDVPFPVFPDCPGLFPWGSDVNGNTMYWLTDGDEDAWPVVVWPEGGDASDFQRFDIPMTTFLAKAIRREVNCKMWEDAKAFFDRTATRFDPAS